MMEFKLAVVGTRTFDDYDLLKKILDPYLIHSNLEIVSGGAKGADSLARRWANENNITFTEFSANWANEGLSAGPKRNREIAEYSDYCIAFWNLKSRGTKGTINFFLDATKPVVIVPYKGKK